MIKTMKIAVSIPKEDFEKIESVRKKSKLHRSAIIHKAIRYYFKNMEEQELIKQYEEGYRKKPESLKEIGAAEKSSMDAFKEGGLYEAW